MTYDPELHLIRSVGQLAEGRGRHDIESARFALWKAIDTEDHGTASRWIAALDVALRTYAREDVRQAALGALDVIRRGLTRAE